jgi:hypothetical protein
MLHPNSAWGSIGITNEGLIYLMVCDHITNAGIYEYNTKTDKLFFLGTAADHFKVRHHFQRQPKVHTPLYQYAGDSLVYFGTDAGDWSEGALYGHFDEGYIGGRLGTVNPFTKEVMDLGLVKRFGGTKCLVLDNENGLVYFNGSPTCNFYKYEIKTGKLVDLGRVNGFKVTRTLFFDKWNNVYNTSETGNLVRHNLEKDTLEFLDTFLPGRSNSGPSQIAYGPNRDFIIGFGGYDGFIYKYTPDKEGNGKMEPLGNLFEKEGTIARNMNFHDNKAYILCTSTEEVPAEERFRGFIVFDIVNKKVVKKVDVDNRIQQAYGHPIMDDGGNMYLAGFWDASDYNLPKDVTSRIFLLKFNPKDI